MLYGCGCGCVIWSFKSETEALKYKGHGINTFAALCHADLKKKCISLLLYFLNKISLLMYLSLNISLIMSIIDLILILSNGVVWL